ncbi:MAG: RNA polymerase sigma factor [Planctomycetota bacterium]|nr:MAG: RNA polymerase sigma factor [Planctomycetota bacterium]
MRPCPPADSAFSICAAPENRKASRPIRHISKERRRDMPQAEPQPDRRPTASATPLDPSRFAVLFTETFQTLWLIAVGIVGDRALAEDVVQEAAIVALGKLEHFEPDSNFRAWMSTITRNVALNAARKRSRRPEAELDPSALEGGAGGSAAAGRAAHESDERLAPDTREFDDAVWGALRLVGDTARACLLLRTIEEMPYGEISRLLAIPEGTAMSHVHRARRTVREHLMRRQSRDAESRQGGRP